MQSIELDDESDGEEDTGDHHGRTLYDAAHRPQPEQSGQEHGDCADARDENSDFLQVALLRGGHNEEKVHAPEYRLSLGQMPDRRHRAIPIVALRVTDPPFWAREPGTECPVGRSEVGAVASAPYGPLRTG